MPARSQRIESGGSQEITRGEENGAQRLKERSEEDCKMTKEEEKAMEKLKERCNQIGWDCDIYFEMNKYKALREATETTRDEVYDVVAEYIA